MTLEQIVTLKLKQLDIGDIKYDSSGEFEFQYNGRTYILQVLDLISSITKEHLLNISKQFSCCGIEVKPEDLRCHSCQESI